MSYRIKEPHDWHAGHRVGELPESALGVIDCAPLSPSGCGAAALLSQRAVQQNAPRSPIRTWEMDTLSLRPAPLP